MASDEFQFGSGEAPVPSERPDPAEVTLLVVDDEPFNVDILRIELEDRGYRVICAEDGVEALALLEDESADLALLDVMMPRMDGFELTRRLRADERHKEMPIILLTAKGELGDKSEGFAGGADDYVVKPFDIADVLARVDTQLTIAWHLRKLRDMETAQARIAMVGAAAHELAQPLSGACGYLQLLQTGLESGRSMETVGGRLEQIRVCLGKTRALADKMERLERIELEDYACGLHIVNIHGTGTMPTPPTDADNRASVLVADLLGSGDRALLRDLGRQGFRVVEEDELAGEAPPPVDLLLMITTDRPDLVGERLERLRPLLAACCPVPPPAMAVLPAPIGDGAPGLGLLALGLADVLARPFQLEELLLRMRSRIRLQRLRVQRLDAARLVAALGVSQRALSRMRPALERGEELLVDLRSDSADLLPRLGELSDQLDTLTATIRDLQARRLDRIEGAIR